MKQLTPEGIKHTTLEMWGKFCDHVMKLENQYFESDGILEEATEEFTIELTPDDSDSEIEDEEMIDTNDRELIENTLKCSNTGADADTTDCGREHGPKLPLTEGECLELTEFSTSRCSVPHSFHHGNRLSASWKIRHCHSTHPWSQHGLLLPLPLGCFHPPIPSLSTHR